MTTSLAGSMMNTTNRKPNAPLPLTELRSQLFRLAEEVLSGRRERLELSHRNFSETLVLMRASQLHALEQELTLLRGSAAPAMRPLRGLAHATTPVSVLLAAVRGRQRALSNAKSSVHYPRVEQAVRRVRESPAKKER
jgi:hypothetical protein